MNVSPHSDRRRWMMIVFVVALLVRGAYLIEVARCPFFAFRIGDAREYHDWAVRIAEGEWHQKSAFYQAPLYPYLLAVIYRLLSPARLSVAVCQILCSSTACVFLCDAGYRFFEKWTGRFSGLLLACYGPAFFFDALIQKTSLELLLLSVMLSLLGRQFTAPCHSRWLLLGLTFGLLLLTREHAFALGPVLMLWTWRRRLPPTQYRVTSISLLLAGWAIAVLPAVVHNAFASGELHVSTSQFGPNLFIGNNPEATGMYVPLVFGRGDAEFERTDARRLAEEAAGRALSPGEVSSYWTRRALQHVSEQPLDWMRLQGTKACLLVNRAEIADTEDLYAYADHSCTLAYASKLWHFGWLAPLACLGVFATWKQRSRLWILYALTISYAVSVLLFFVSARYRLPLVPLLILFAAAGIVHAVPLLRTATLRKRIILSTCVIVVAAISNGPGVDVNRMCGITYYNFGTQFERAGNLRNAIEAYQSAAKSNPLHVETRFNLGNCFARTGQYDAAIREFTQALELKPDFSSATVNLGNVYFDRGQLDLAEQAFVRTLAIESENPLALNGLGMIAARGGQFEEALRYFELAIKSAPNFANAQDNAARAGEILRMQRESREEGEHPGADTPGSP